LSLLFVAVPLQAQKIAPVMSDTATVVYDDEGLRIHSSDGRRQLRIRGLLDFDGRVVTSDTNDAAPNSLSMHRARLIFDANVNPYVAFRMSVDVLTVGAAPVIDAFADITLSRHWWIRAGKQKTPYGLERYMPISEHFFPERSIATALTSSRDGGVLLTGQFGDGRYEGSVGVFNGIPDGAIGDADVNDAKDVTLRLQYRPVMRQGGQGILLGFNGTSGIQRGTLSTSQLPKFLLCVL
jgi:phosphate-selective porin OprO/OprP